ncbi:hypothetical protein Tco_0874822 [Tanacetum coccineum]|uniref:DUF4283 domain-containing protein n=1 Tax=Tanacetum coccineum TaxID=301880 RepID=A0ABQ5BMQ3_9ASTR
MAGSDDEIPPPPPPPQTQTPTQQAPYTFSTIKLPILKKGEYDIWAMKMEHQIRYWLARKIYIELGSTSGIRACRETLNDEIPPPPPPPQTQTPTQQAPHTVSTIKLPILKKGEYDIWAMKMEHYLASLYLQHQKAVAYPVIANYVRNTWGKYGLVNSMLNSSTRIFSFQFSSIDDLDAVPKNGPWFIRNNPLILKKWNPNVNLLKEDVVNVLV